MYPGPLNIALIWQTLESLPSICWSIITKDGKAQSFPSPPVSLVCPFYYSRRTLTAFLVTKRVFFFFFWHKEFSTTPSGCPVIYSVPTVWTWRLYHMLHLKDSVSQNFPAPPDFRSQMWVVGPQVTTKICPTWLQTGGSHDFLLEFHSFAKVAHRTQGNTFVLTSLLKDLTKDTMNSQIKGYIG